MSRLIEAEEFKNAIHESYNPYQDYWAATISRMHELIDDQPTVDAVEVVRCENCEYFMEDIFKRTVCNRTFDMFVMKANDFCSYGKRKIGGEKE